MQTKASLLGKFINKLILNATADVKYQNKPVDFAWLLEKYAKLNMTPQVFIESILPVVFDCRLATCCFNDQLNLLNIEKDLEHIIAFSAGLKFAFNINVQVICVDIPSDKLLLFIFFKDNKYYNKINALQEHASKIMASSEGADVFGDQKFVEGLGNLLAYPKCCIAKYIKIRKLGESVEGKAFEELQLALQTVKANKLCYFAYEFYPCNPNCKNAAKIGEKILHAMAKLGEPWVGAWDEILVYNMSRVFNVNADMNTNIRNQKLLNKKIQSMFGIGFLSKLFGGHV